MDSIHLVKDRDTNRLQGNTVMNHHVPKMHRISKQQKKYQLFSKKSAPWSQLSTSTLLAKQFTWSLKDGQTQRPNKWHFSCNLHTSYLPTTVCSLHSSQQASLCAYGVQAFRVAPHLQSCNSHDTSPSQPHCPGATPGSGNRVTTVSFSPAYCTLSHIPTTSALNTHTSNCDKWSIQQDMGFTFLEIYPCF